MFLSKIPKVVFLLSLLALVLPLSVASGQVAGSAVIRDSSPGLSDQISVTLADVPPLGDAEAYEGWLVSDDGSEKLSVGILAVDANGVIDTSGDPYVNADGVNLTSIYDKFVITIEPVPDTDPGPSDRAAFSDQIPAAGMAHIRHLLYSWSGNPAYSSGAHEGTAKGIVPGLWEQTNTALTHANLSASSATLAAVHLHAAHVINIVEGSDGANFVADAGNPGDGFGVLNYAADARKHAGFIVAALPSDATFVQFEPQVSESSDNVADWAGQARDFAILSRNQTNVTVATAFIENSKSLLTRALNGNDADRDGSIALGGSEGGATQTQWAAQNMATYNPREGAALPATGDVSWTLFAIIALAAGAVLVTAGGLVLRRGRATA